MPLDFSQIDNTWAGHYKRHENTDWPELYMYSKTDRYLPYTYMEETIEMRKKGNKRMVFTKKWDKSVHVCHLQEHPEEYPAAIQHFLFEVYFSDQVKTYRIKQNRQQLKREDDRKLVSATG
jgi:hypothetical protein